MIGWVMIIIAVSFRKKASQLNIPLPRVLRRLTMPEEWKAGSLGTALPCLQSHLRRDGVATLEDIGRVSSVVVFTAFSFVKYRGAANLTITNGYSSKFCLDAVETGSSAQHLQSESQL